MMLLWKDTFTTSTTEDETSQQPGEDLANEPWKAWPRPPGGFLDLGCVSLSFDVYVYVSSYESAFSAAATVS